MNLNFLGVYIIKNVIITRTFLDFNKILYFVSKKGSCNENPKNPQVVSKTEEIVMHRDFKIYRYQNLKLLYDR